MSLSEKTDRIEKILSTIPINISVVNSYTKNGEIVVEGIETVRIKYSTPSLRSFDVKYSDFLMNLSIPNP